MEINSIVSTKLKGLTPDTDVMNLCIAEAKQYILDYCNISVIPEALNFTCANIAVDLYKYQTEINKDTSQMSLEDAVDPSNIASIKEGDTTITLGVAKNATNISARGVTLSSHTPDLDKIVMNYTAILQKYRILL